MSTELTSCYEELGIFWREWNAVAFAVSFRRFHCWVWTVTVLLYSSKFVGPWWGQKFLSVVQCMLNKNARSLEVDGLSVSSSSSQGREKLGCFWNRHTFIVGQWTSSRWYIWVLHCPLFLLGEFYFSTSVTEVIHTVHTLTGIRICMK